MENQRENFSMITRLKVSGNQTDALAERLYFERLLSAADFHPPGFSRRAIVCLRKIKAPPVSEKHAKQNLGRLAHEWETKIRREIENLARRAFRPIGESVPAQAECVIFEDRAELLACLARDWQRGALRENWWWRAIFPNLSRAEMPFDIWLAEAEFVPFALNILSKKSEAENFVKKLAPFDAFRLFEKVVQKFGLDRLKVVLSAPPIKNPFAGQASKSGGKKRVRQAVELSEDFNTRKISPYFIDEFKTTNLSFEQILLLETSLLLARAPRRARSEEFAAHVQILRLKNERRKTAETEKTASFVAFQKAPEKSVQERAERVRRVSEKNAFDFERPPWQIKEKPVLLVQKKEKNKMRAEKQESLPAPQTSGQKTAEPEKPAKSAKSSKIVFERPAATEQVRTVETINVVNKIIFKESLAQQKIFESFFEDLETGERFVFQTRFGGIFYLLNLGLFLGLYRDFTEALTDEIGLNIWDFAALLSFEFLGGRIKTDPVWDFLERAADREDESDMEHEFEDFRDWRMPPAWLETFATKEEWRWRRTANRLIVRHPAGFNLIDVEVRGKLKSQLNHELEIYRGNFVAITKAEKGIRRELKSKKWHGNLAEYLEKRLFQALDVQTRHELNAVLFERAAMISVSATHLEITFALADLPIAVRLAGIDRDPGWIPAAGKFVYFHFE